MLIGNECTADPARFTNWSQFPAQLKRLESRALAPGLWRSAGRNAVTLTEPSHQGSGGRHDGACVAGAQTGINARVQIAKTTLPFVEMMADSVQIAACRSICQASSGWLAWAGGLTWTNWTGLGRLIGFDGPGCGAGNDDARPCQCFQRFHCHSPHRFAGARKTDR